MPAELSVKERDNSRHSITRGLRKEGKIPAVVYGKTVGNRPISVDERDMLRVFRESGRNGVLNLNLGGQAFSAMVYDFQVDPLKGHFLHIDFLEVDMKIETEAVVPLHLVGESIGQKEGGVVQQVINEVTVRALPANIPQALEVDISSLAIGDVLKIKDIKSDQNYDILHEEDEVILSITPPALEPDAEVESSDDSPEVEVEPVGNSEGE